MSFVKRRSKLITLSVALLLAGAAESAWAKTLAKVDGVEITDEDLRFMIDDLGPKIPRQMQDKARDAFLLKLLIDKQVVIAAARAQKFEQRPEFAKRFAYLQGKALHEAMIADVAKSAATEEALKAAYDDLVERQKRQIEYGVEQAVFATEDEARSAHQRLLKGEDFAKIVAEGVKESGPSNSGDVGWLPKETIEARFGEGVLKLEPGHFSEPTKTLGKWAIVKYGGQRSRPAPPFEKVRAQLQRYVEQKAQSDFVAKLREGAKIELEETSPSAGDAPPPAAGK